MKLSLKPTDTFFFRDGKPFSRGEQSEATGAGIFPPFPSTVYGALRGAYIGEKGWEQFKQGALKDSIGTEQSYQSAHFRLKGVFLQHARYGTIYLTLPRDLVAEKKFLEPPRTSTDRVHRLSLTQLEASSSSPCSKILMNVLSPEIAVEYPSRGAFINNETMKHYLLDQDEGLTLYTTDAFLISEPKIGIARNSKTHTTEQGHLYKLNMLRLAPEYNLLADTDGVQFSPTGGILKLGGENKPFSYVPSKTSGSMEYTPEEKEELVNAIAETKMFKLYLATPAIWEAGEQGWLPGWMKARQEFTYHTLTCRLITAAIGSYQNVGGWDIAHHRPKAMHRAVQAGSIYYLELVSGNPEDVLNIFHNTNLVDYDIASGRPKADWAREGFGLTFVGKVAPTP